MDFLLSAVSLSIGRYTMVSRLSPPNNPKHMMNPLTLLRKSGQNDLLGHTRQTPQNKIPFSPFLTRFADTS